MKNRNLITYNVSVSPNISMAGKWLGWRDLDISGDLSDGGKYSFGFLIGPSYDVTQIYGLFKVFCNNNRISFNPPQQA